MNNLKIDTGSLGSPSPGTGTPTSVVAEVETVPLTELESAICAWAGRIAAATCQLLVMLAAFDRRRGWSGLGMATCAQWLSWRCGLGIRTAQEHLAVAHALEELPAVRAAFAEGRLSYSKVRAVARVAEAATEQTWLSHALHCTAGQLERLASRYHQLTADPARQRAARKVTWDTRADGLFRLQAVLTAEEGVRLATAIDAARATLDDSSPARTGGEAEASPADGEIVNAPRDRRADADALVALADGFLHRPVPDLMSPSHTVTVHVDAETLLSTGQRAVDARGPAREAAGDGGGRPEMPADAVAAATDPDPVSRLVRGLLRCDAEPGIGLPRAALRRLGCDGLVRTLVRDTAGNPLALGRRRRVPNRRLREAVHARDQGTCQYPGCTHTRWLQVHHLLEWLADEGATDLENLTLVCGSHHQLVHDEGIALSRRGDGKIVATLADGFVVIPAPRLNAGPQPAAHLAAVTRDVDADAIRTHDGGRLSWDDSLLVLMQHRRPSAGSPAA
ncbi:HNH endonuclease signature motif containing protein [Pseudofrankia asymbiotica]|uniref:HNH endonuclease n=1 Tax=Pseudofrankia asymbiotica TaxID=1834516 RepID=A0A1V2IE33_9ACTN|nr:HNH endonuclease signature motif containing protein [Pseudofrankia asymbiotica]ONH31280.1 HNH endonuclease [Pseudofrankia asymbiotica]